MERLIYSILLMAVKDIEDNKYKQEVYDFFNSSWFEILAETLELNPAEIREKIETGTYNSVTIRTAYR